jgi:hypothetical protein
MNMTSNTRNTEISSAVMLIVSAIVTIACLGAVTLATGGRQFSHSAYSYPIAGFLGGLIALYLLSWTIAGAAYLLSFGRMSRSWILSVTISLIIILSCLNYRGLAMG